MSLRNDIEAKYLEAMKAKDAPTVSAMRMLRAAVKNQQIEKMKELSDEDVQDVIAKEVKKLKDSAADFEKGGRPDLGAGVQGEIAILSKFLPAQLSEEEVRAVVKEKIAALGVSGPAGAGKLTGEVMKALKGRADGTMVSRLVKEQLQ